MISATDGGRAHRSKVTSCRHRAEARPGDRARSYPQCSWWGLSGWRIKDAAGSSIGRDIFELPFLPARRRLLSTGTTRDDRTFEISQELATAVARPPTHSEKNSTSC